MRRITYVATALLIVVAGIWLVAHRFGSLPGAAAYWPWIEAFAEAALIGALADWFAVTALFRRPLGLPIPHTGIIPNRRKEIAIALGRFVEDNFLSEEVLGRRVREQQLAQKMGEWLQVEANAANVADRVVPLVTSLIEMGGTTTLRQALGKALRHGAAGLDIATLSARILRASTDQSNLAPLLDALLKTTATMLRKHGAFVQESLAEELPWYVPRFIHDRIYREVIARIQHRLDTAIADPANALRIQITQALVRFATELEVTPSLRHGINDSFHRLVTHAELGAFLDTLSESLLQELGAGLSRNQLAATAAVAGSARELGLTIATKPELAASLNHLAEQGARGFARHYRHVVGQLIADTMQRWDTKELVAKVESEIGDDLAFIRINGTIVGGLCGVGLYALGQWMH